VRVGRIGAFLRPVDAVPRPYSDADMRAGRLARLCVVPTLAGIFLIATAAPAWAHAILKSTNPPKDGVAAQAPGQISLTYNENVEVAFGAIRIYTCAGKRLTTGAPTHSPTSGHTVLVSVPKLDNGVYLVAWRVISADSHPVSGTYSFRIGPGPAPTVNACATETNPKSSSTVGALFGVARAGVFTGLALLIGGAIFLVLIAGGTSAARSTRRLIWIGWIVLALSTVAAVMMQGPYAAGAGIGDAVKWTVVHAVFKTRFGHVTEVRLLLLVAALVLLFFLRTIDRSGRPPLWWTIAGVIVAVGLAGTPGYAGHAAAGTFTDFAVPLDTVHVLAMSVWLGGLVVLLVAALGGGFSGGIRQALNTFSRLAFWCVVVLILSGIFASWRQVGFTVKGYTGTSYGHLLLIKLAIVVALVAFAAMSRSIVRQRRSAPLDAPDSAIAAIDEKTVSGLRRSVAGEVVLGIAVLAVTAILVNAQPARSELAPKLFSGQVAAGTGPTSMIIEVTVDPAHTGPNEVHVYTLTPKGADLAIRGMSAKFQSNDGSTTVPAGLVRGGPNHFLTNNATFVSSGKYKMLVNVDQLINGSLVDTAAVLNVPIS
jgi:copper transport protein